MVILGGLEFVVGGYLVHKHYKNKNEKKKLQAETHQRRNNTFPRANKPNQYQQPPYQQPQCLQPQCQPQYQHQYQPQNQPQHQPQYQSQPHPNTITPQPTSTSLHKYACHAQQMPSRAQTHPQPQPYGDSQPHPISQSQTFRIQRRPVLPPRPRPQPQQPPPQIIQPLHRADSSATISRMPVANGYRPGGMNGNPSQLAPQPQVGTLSPIPGSPYSSPGFSVSSPALNISPTTPQTPVYGTGIHGGTQSIDDNWETYASPNGRTNYAPSVSTALGERYDPDEPPPPYRP